MVVTKPADQPRTEPAMTSLHQDATSCQWFPRLASALDRRSAIRLVQLFLGAVLARGRRTVTSWIRAAGLSRKYQPCYTTVAAAGKQADNIAARLVNEAVNPWLLARHGSPWPSTTPRHSGMVLTCRGPASITTRLRARPGRRTSTATSGWCSGCWPSIPLGG